MSKLYSFLQFQNPLSNVRSSNAESDTSDPSKRSQSNDIPRSLDDALPYHNFITTYENENKTDTESDSDSEFSTRTQQQEEEEEAHHRAHCTCNTITHPPAISRPPPRKSHQRIAPKPLNPSPTDFHTLYISLLTHIHRTQHPTSTTCAIALMVRKLLYNIHLSNKIKDNNTKTSYHTRTHAHTSEKLAKYKEGIYIALGRGNEAFEKAVRVVERGMGKICKYHGWLSGKGGCLCEEVVVVEGAGRAEGVWVGDAVGFNWRGFVERGVMQFFGSEGRWEDAF